MTDIITYGKYYTQLKPFIEVFGLSKMHFIDGGGLVTSPTREFQSIESFLGLRDELEFKFNEEKGFPCLHRPVPMCLSKAKGRTRGTNTKVKPEEVIPDKMAAIRQYYRTEMEQMFQIVHPEVTVEAFCEDPSIYRFDWLSKIICTN